MNSNHENLLHGIINDYPAEMEEMKNYEHLKPPVTKEYLASLCEGDEELEALFDEMIEYFYRYTRDVCVQESLKHEKDGLEKNLEEIKALDVQRTALHDAMIDSVKILARNLSQRGKDVSWFQGIDNKGRAGYASLALLVTFVDILNQDALGREEAV